VRLDGLYRIWAPGQADSRDFRVEGGHPVDADSWVEANVLPRWAELLAPAVAIVGTRPPWKGSEAEWATFHVITRDVAAFVEALPDRATVVSGGARGVDTTAREMSRRRGLWVFECLPDYIRYCGSQAPLMRNTVIVATAGGAVHCWPSPWSRGTRDTQEKAGDRAVVHRPWLTPARRAAG
jgi:hypothetical protein